MKKTKRSLSLFLALVLCLGILPAGVMAENYEGDLETEAKDQIDNGSEEEPIVSLTFEEGTDYEDILTLFGNAKVTKDSGTNGSKILSMDGAVGTYAAFKTGFFDGRDTMTISMDVNTNMSDSDNFFTFTMGKSDSVYMFMRTRPTTWSNVITTGSWGAESGTSYKFSSSQAGQWHNIKIVINEREMRLYIDNVLGATNSSLDDVVSDLGNNLEAFLGKSFYSADKYFNGAFDNIEIYDRALSDEEISGSSVVNTSIDVSDITIEQGGTVTLPNTVTASYSDGSDKTFGVSWDEDDINAIDTTKAGTYTISGTVNQTTYSEALVGQRADPWVVLADDGYYYFTASYPVVGTYDTEGYDRIVLRRSKTIDGLTDAEEVTIWHQENSGKAYRYVWAPELHQINGKWYVLFAASTASNNIWNIRPYILECMGDDLMNPDSWKTDDESNLHQMTAQSGDNFSFTGFSLDMTYFEVNGTHYVVWAQKPSTSNLYIATIDPDNPWQLTSEGILLSQPDYAWESGSGETINEGAVALIRDNTIYLFFSGGATDYTYCVGMLSADLSDNLLDKSSWTKNPAPLLSTDDLEEQYGPGHNSFTTDENGNLVIIYHARPEDCDSSAGTGSCNYIAGTSGSALQDPCRHARAKSVNFAADGTPILNMTEEEELLPENQTVTLTITVEDDEPEPATLIADLSFDGDNGLQGAGAKAEVQGTAVYGESYDGTQAASISSSFWLNLTKEDGTPLLAGLEELTISYDSAPNASNNVGWTFYASADTTQQTYLSERYLGVMDKTSSVTVERYNNSGARPYSLSASTNSEWKHIDIVITETESKIYVDGVLQDSSNSDYKLSDIVSADGGIIQIGKANWGSGEYYNGYLDNFKLYNYAKTKEDIAEDFGVALQLLQGAQVGTGTPSDSLGADDHTATYTSIDYENKTINSYVRSWADITDVEFTFTTLNDSVTASIESGSTLDLTEPKTFMITDGNITEQWTIETPAIGNNSVLQGQYADPDIDVFDGKYYIYPTTDGYDSWSGTQFKVFSSDDLVNWEDEGYILDVSNNNVNGEDNENGIPGVPWSVGSAWAPTIEEKNGKYYFYFCAKESSGVSAIGVAVADDPAGPFVAQDEPLITMSICSAAGISMGQAIDPSIYTDTDGTSYMLFGNGSGAIVELGEDMVSLVSGTMKNISGLTDFRESVVVIKIGDTYHWTWSCDDTGSANYHVNYGTSTSLYGAVTYKYTLLEKDTSQGIQGTAHQDILEVPKEDGSIEYYITYGRHVTPLNQTFDFGSLGNHREVCIDKIEYDESTGLLQAVTPTHKGVSETYAYTDKPVVYYDMSLTDDSSALKDISGNGWDAELSSAVSENDFYDGIWTLTENSGNNKYASIPHGVIEDGNFSIEVRATVDATADQFLWVLGTTEGSWPTPANYIFLNPKSAQSGYSGKMLAAIKDSSTEKRSDSTNMPTLSTNLYYTMTVTSEDGILKLYVNGDQVDTLSHGYSALVIEDILNGNNDSILGYIGKSLYTGDAGYTGKIDSFKIYNYTQSDTEIKGNYEANNKVLADALDTVTIPNADDIRGNITLPDEINGVKLTWEEVTGTGIVTLESSTNENYDETPAGVVTRQATDTEVTLRVTATYNGESISKEIAITVKAKASELLDEDFTGYLMAYFAGDGTTTEQVYLAVSEDGLNWTNLNDGSPVLTSTLGENGIRDPYLARSPEGDKFYLVATDLCIGNGDTGNSGSVWMRAGREGSQSIMIWESTDLVNWSEQRMVEVSADIGAGCTWAPEFAYDEITGEYIVFWSSIVPDDNYAHYRVYYSKTRDFYTFTQPEVYIENGATTDGVIDSTIIYNESDGYYYRYSKNETAATVYLDRSTTILGEWDRLFNSYGYGVEGPSVFKFNSKDADTDKWCLLLDNYYNTSIRYYPTVVTDLADTSTYAVPENYIMPTPVACHGSVVNLTSEEYANIVKAYTDLVTEKVTYVATYTGQLPILPATVAGIDDDGNKTTYDVVWDDSITSDDFATEYDTVKVTGVAEGIEVTCYVEVIPRNLKYFIDANSYSGSNTTDGSSNTTPAYAAVAGLADLLNTGADQLYDSSSNTWGFKTSDGYTYTKDAESGDYDKQTTTGRYGTNTNNTYISYYLTLTKGTYKLTAGSYSWWPGNTRTEVIKIYSDGNEISDLGTYTLNSSNYSYVIESDEFTLLEDGVIEFRMTAITNNQAPMFSWLGVQEIGEIVEDYTLTFETNGGSSIESITRAEGTDIDLSEYAPEKEGYNFAGWYSDEALTEPVTTVTLTANTTVYAKWTEGEVEATEIKIDSSALVIIRKNATLQLNVNVTPANATPNITWTSSNSDVASVDENGLVTANKVGTVQIKATTDNGLVSSIVIRISA